MDLVYQNPFRVLALPVTANDRDIAKRLSDLAIYVEMGQNIEYPSDNYFSPKPVRTPDSIFRAKQKIEQPRDKLFYSLFWFWDESTNTVDQMAFDALRNGNYEQALSFWEQEANKEISILNKSNYKNLFTLQLALSSQKGEFIKEYFLNGILNSGKFLGNGYFEDFSQKVIGGKHSIVLDDISKLFVDEVIAIVKPYIDDYEKRDIVSIQELLAHFRTYSESFQNEVIDRFTAKYIHNIERQIGLASQTYEEDISQASKAGFNLYNKTREDLLRLYSALSINQLKYQIIADKLANEIVNCSIAFFNEFRDTEIDPGEEALTLLQISRDIAVGEKLRDRIDEGLPVVQEYVDDKPQRDKLLPVKNERKLIYNLLTELNSNIPSSQLPEKASQLVDRAGPSLTVISRVLGDRDQDYLKLSDIVSSNAIGMCVEFLKWVVDDADRTFRNNDSARRMVMQNAVTKVRTAFLKIETLDMKPETRSNLREIRKNIGITSQSSNSTSASSGCYIATMVYGSYESPQVRVLRRFRDDVLLKSFVGSAFVKIYYLISPSLVEKTRKMTSVKSIIRSILDKVIVQLKGHYEI